MLDDKSYVFKPTISGSGENTYLVTNSNDKSIPNTIQKEDIVKIYNKMLYDNSDCKIMIQPFILEISNGEYSCIFIDGKLTHTMLRFPNIFHEKRKPYLVDNAPDSIIQLARVVERIKEFNNYLYMRVDMVLVNGKAKIMEVELTDPDLLTKYINDSNVKSNVIKTFAKKSKRELDKMKTYKIVLTCGSCSGKTDSIEFLSKKLIEQDNSVKIFNETADSLLNWDTCQV